MLKKLVVFAITSGLAAKLYQTRREKNIAAGNIPDPNRTKRPPATKAA
jgi:hypothetical protein